MKFARGASLTDVVASIACVGVTSLVLAAHGAQTRIAGQQASTKNGLRAVSQALLIWSFDNRGSYPLPSSIDTSDATVREEGAAKNTTSNIFSLLVWNRTIMPEMLVSTDERSPNIKPDEDYNYTAPAGVLDKDLAMWDPSFNADFTGDTPGNLSYAHQLPIAWQPLPIPKPILSSRGSAIERKVDPRSSLASFTYANPSSLHLQEGRWEGFVAYSEGHVEFRNEPFSTSPDGSWDNYFIDERSCNSEINSYLSIFTKAGESRGDFNAIWD
jgi:hypothetical protein